MLKSIIENICIIISVVATTNLSSTENKSYIGLIAGVNTTTVDLWSKNDNISDYHWDSGVPISIGVEYTYDFFLLNYIASTNLERHESNLLLTNNEFVFRNQLIYQGKYEGVQLDGDHHAKGWSNEYDGKKYSSCTSFRHVVEFGYFFSYDFGIIEEVSYKMIFLHNETQETGIGLGILASILYDNSSLSSDVMLIPEGEREYYNKTGEYKGDEIVTIGPQITPIISYMMENNTFIACGIPILLYPYRYGQIILEDKKIDAEFKYNPVGCFYLTAGTKMSSVIWSVMFSGDGYKYYKLPDESSVEIGEYIYHLELHAGVVF